MMFLLLMPSVVRDDLPQVKLHGAAVRYSTPEDTEGYREFCKIQMILKDTAFLEDTE